MLAKTEQLILQDLVAATQRCQGAEWTVSAGSMSVRGSGATGFDLTMVIEGGQITLAFDEWVEVFEDIDYARRLFEAALNGTARLRVELLSRRRWRWTLERLDAADQWVAESTISHPIWRFWGETSVLHLRNTFRPQAEDPGNAPDLVAADPLVVKA